MNLKKGCPILPKFKLGILGGTFDHFHLGQKFFLKKSFQFCEKIIIGLTSDEFTKSKFLATAVLPFKKRRQELEEFLKEKEFLRRTRIIKINNPFPLAIFNPQIECLFITKKTEKNAQILNLKRIKKNLPPLKIIKVPIVTNSQGECFSSEKIRSGDMDRKGEIYIEDKFFEKTFFPPKKLRSILKNPLGRLLLGSEKKIQTAALKVKEKLKLFPPVFLVTVGDIVTLSLVKERVIPDLSIVDFKVGRKQIYQNISQLGFSSKIRVKEAINEPGTLNPELFQAIKSFSGKSSLVIRVLGEEDLAVLPAVLLLPLNSFVCYGQPGKGIVVIKITERIKQKFKKVVHQFQEKDRE